VELADLLLSSDIHTAWPNWYGRLLAFNYFHSENIRTLYPLHSLGLSWEVFPSKADAVKHEQLYYYNYRQAFGELPPFNRDFSMNKWISTADEQRQRGPLIMPHNGYIKK
jgi:hypothetical protein